MKRALLRVTDVLLVEILKGMTSGFRGSFLVIENGLPADAKPIRTMMLNDGVVGILIESESFADIEHGALYPDLNPVVFARKDQVID